MVDLRITPLAGSILSGVLLQKAPAELHKAMGGLYLKTRHLMRMKYDRQHHRRLSSRTIRRCCVEAERKVLGKGVLLGPERRRFHHLMVADNFVRDNAIARPTDNVSSSFGSHWWLRRADTALPIGDISALGIIREWLRYQDTLGEWSLAIAMSGVVPRDNRIWESHIWSKFCRDVRADPRTVEFKCRDRQDILQEHTPYAMQAMYLELGQRPMTLDLPKMEIK